MFDSATPSSLFGLTLLALVQSLTRAATNIDFKPALCEDVYLFVFTIFQTTHTVLTRSPQEEAVRKSRSLIRTYTFRKYFLIG